MEDSGGSNEFKYVVIGGGITGVSVVEQLRSLDDEGSILMITQSDVVQAASKINRITMNLEEFIVVEKSFETFKDVDQMLVVVKDTVVSMDPDNHTVTTRNQLLYKYEFLCICSGASPNVVSFQELDGYDFSDHIIGIRDTPSVAKITELLSRTTRVMVVGNGGIATEFVYETRNVDIIWAIKDSSVSYHYFDSGAACFLLSSMPFLQSCESAEDAHTNTVKGANVPTVLKRLKYTADQVATDEHDSGNQFTAGGSALGPDWHNDFCLHGVAKNKTVDIQYETEVQRLFAPEVHYDLIASEFGVDEAIESKKWRTYVELTNGKRFGVDWILSATGVIPNTDWFPGAKDAKLGICVNDWMHTSLADVFAAGDVCFPCWPKQRNWFPMRLWSQGRTMGICAGSSMYAASTTASEDHARAKRIPTTSELLDIKAVEDTRNEMFGGFDIFTHVTKFFGFRVVLLGLYNGQGIPKKEQTIELRYTPHREYIKVVLSNNRVQGAVLIGDTGLEETFEHLILCQVDISKIGNGSLLDPNIDLEDYFD